MAKYIVVVAAPDPSIPTTTLTKRAPSMSFASLMRRPGAYLPLALSTAALAMVVGHIVSFAIVPPHVLFPPPLPGEGALRPFYLLLIAQLPLMTAFALKWLPRAPRTAALVLLLQVLMAAAPLVLLMVLMRFT
jgi:hypothetical protein